MKKIRVLLAMLLALVCLLATFVMATSAEEETNTEETEGAEEKTITISFMNTHDTLSTSTTLDKTAHTDGKITVKAGEKFALPTTSSDSKTGVDGFRLIWYTENGRTYNAGEEVSFTEDTKLFRRAAKEAGTAEEVAAAIRTDPYAVVLTADVEYSSNLWFHEEKHNIIFFDGHTITFKGNINGLGAKRSGEYLYGKGTINFVDYTTTPGSKYVLEARSHSHNGQAGRDVIGVDITINAPNHKLMDDSDGSYVQGYPWVKVYGKINVYSLGSVYGGNRSPRIQFFEGSEATITSVDKIFNDRYTLSWNRHWQDNKQKLQLTIKGGTFYLPEEAKNIYYWTQDYKPTVVDGNKTYEVLPLTPANRDVFDVTGGSFNIKLPDGILKNGYQCVYNDETGLYDVEYVGCTLEGSNGTHNFVPLDSYEGFVSTCEEMGVYYFRCSCGDYYVDAVDAVGHSYDVIVSETPATCTTKAYKTYKCVRCDSTQNVEYGSELGHDYSIVTIEKLATLTENGVKRFTCVRCADAYTIEYSFDPSEQQISIVVKSGEGTKTIVVRAGDLYNVDGNALKGINSIVDPDDAEVTYAVTDLVEIVIPAGFTDLPADAISGATSLEKITLLDNANITFATGSIKNCPALTTIVVGEATVVFKSGALSSCSVFTILDLEKANATFEKTAFQNSSIQHLKLGTEKTYSFGENSFKNAKLTEMVFPDESNITFPGAAAFYGCPNLTYVYFGTGTGVEHDNKYSNAILNKPFDCCYAIETLVLMDIDYINEYVFCTEGNANSGKSYRERVANGLVVYHHGDSLALNDNAFANRGVYGVKLYTSSSVTSLKNCVYTIYNGIPHAYTTVTEKTEATCTTAGSLANGVITDCPCGALTDASYTIYSTADTSIHGTTGSVSISEDSVIPATGHEFDVADGATIYSTTDATCTKNGTITYKCANCDETQTVDDETKPATDHDIDGVEYIVTIQESCTTQGLKTKNCKNCKAPIENEVIPENGHNTDSVEWTKISDPTCTLAGTEVKYCSTCGVVAETHAISALGHTDSEWAITLNPDCDDEGLKEQKCTVCQILIATEVLEKLGHEYDLENGAELVGISYPNGFTVNGQSSIDCARCTIVGNFEIEPLFEAKGYSTNPTHTALNGGFTLNTEILPLYEHFNGAISYGIIIANANSFGENSFVDADNKVNSTMAIQVPITAKNYSNFDCSLDGFGLNSGTLELIITAYVIDAEGNISFIQAENDYALEATVGEQTFTKVTLDLVVANVVDNQPDAILPDEE